jgi:hypothetical protein
MRPFQRIIFLKFCHRKANHNRYGWTNLFVSYFPPPSSIVYSFHSLKHEVDFNLFRDFFFSSHSNEQEKGVVIRSFHVTILCCENAITIKYYDCVSILALFTRHTKLVRRIRLSVACLALLYFSILDLIKGKNFWIEFIEHKMCLIFCANFVWKISHSKKNSTTYYRKCTYVVM